METYRKMNQWSSQSRDMVESFKRYYNNSFLDRQRQEAYNLFLGNYTFSQGQPLLWDLSTDYYLHHSNPKAFAANVRKSYAQWYSPRNLEHRVMPPTLPLGSIRSCDTFSSVDDYWPEYYRPITISSFAKILSYKLNSRLDRLPGKTAHEAAYDLSPFKPRVANDSETSERGRSVKELIIKDMHMVKAMDGSSLASHTASPSRQPTLPKWLQRHLNDQPRDRGENLDVQGPSASRAIQEDLQALLTKKSSKDKSGATQWSLCQFVSKSLNPAVSDSEAHEYQRYIDHPLNMSLLTSPDVSSHTSLELCRYLGEPKTLDMDDALKETNTAEYTAFLKNGDDPLTVTEADVVKKRYKAYRQWLKGKSLFKQQRVEN